MSDVALDRPKAIQWFEALWIVWACLSALNIVVVVVSPAGFKIAVLATVIVGVAMGLWVSRGRSQLAKWINTVMVIGGLPFMPAALLSDHPLAARTLLAALSLAQLVAIGLLFTPEARSWLRRTASSSIG